MLAVRAFLRARTRRLLLMLYFCYFYYYIASTIASEEIASLSRKRYCKKQKTLKYKTICTIVELASKIGEDAFFNRDR